MKFIWKKLTPSLMLALVAFAAAPLAAQNEDSDKDDSPKGGVVSELARAAKRAVESGSKAAKDSKTTLSELIKSSDSKTKFKSADKVLVLPIKGNIQERGQELALFGSQPESLKQYVDLLRKARLDDEIHTVVLRLGPNSMGMATVQELREAISELQNRKKRVTAILEDDSQSSYLVAAAADEIVMPPSGDLMLHGVSADSYFLKELLAKVGVKVQILHVGQYKSYGETFTQDEFTTPARRNMNEIVDSVYGQVQQMIADGRKMTAEQADVIINGGPVGAEDAKAAGLIDRVAYGDDVLEELKKSKLSVVKSDDYKSNSSSSSSSDSSDISLLGLISMLSKSDSSSDSSGNYPQVAVLYAVGGITLGSSSGSGLGVDTEIASDDFIQELEKLKNNDKIRAVILRVNSPGGSAFASDLIWKKVEELKTKKPVVASMSDVAASGGYYISMGANKIVAHPGTLTGSIGVVGGKPNLADLYKKIGVNKSNISRGKYAAMFSETRDFNDQETSAVQNIMQRTYEEFVTKAAEGRKRTFDQLHEVAQGRAWTGEAAKEAGLVDVLGGLDTAIVETKALIGLKATDKVRLISYPKEKTLVDIIQKALGTSSSTVRVGLSAWATEAALQAAPVPAGLKAVLTQAALIGKMLERESVLTVMPVLLDVR